RCTAHPSKSGNMMSRTIRSGRNESTSVSASRPDAADATSNPSYRSAVATRSVMYASSSTTSTRAVSGGAEAPWEVTDSSGAIVFASSFRLWRGRLAALGLGGLIGLRHRQSRRPGRLGPAAQILRPLDELFATHLAS